MSLVTFQTANLAKEKSFNESCDNVFENETETRRLNYYEGDGGGFVKNTEINNEFETFLVTAPTQSVLQKWLREECQIEIIVSVCAEAEYSSYEYSVVDCRKEKAVWYNSLQGGGATYTGVYDTYELALEQALQKSLQILKL